MFAELRAALKGTDQRVAIDLAIEIDPTTVRRGDVAVVLPDPPGTGPVAAQLVLLVAEIAVTSLGRDLGDKLADFARADIPDYWVVDVEAKVTHVMCDPEGEHYRSRKVVPFAEPLAVPGTDRTITLD